MKIRNSDILFGRIITSYKWIDKETARESIQEVGALQGFGIDKRLHQVLFERSKVGVDEIYAVLEILLSMQKIPKIKTLITYLFTDDDEKRFYDFLEWKENWKDDQEELTEIPAEWANKKLPILANELLLCVNIKHKLQIAGFSYKLLDIIRDKQLLNTQFLTILPELNERKCVIVSSEKRDSARIHRSIALILSRLAVCNGYMKQEDANKSYLAWESIAHLGIHLRYSEVLYYMGFLEESVLSNLTETLQTTTQIDQIPRLPLIHLNAQERHFLENLHDKGVIPEDIWKKGNDLLKQLQQNGLVKIYLGDVLILQKKLTRKDIAKQWSEYRKKEVANQVKELQLEQTQEARISYLKIERDFQEELAQTEEVMKQADDEVWKYKKQAKYLFNKPVQSATEDKNFEQKLKEDLLSSQEHIRVISKNLVSHDYAKYKIVAVLLAVLVVVVLVFGVLLQKKLQKTEPQQQIKVTEEELNIPYTLQSGLTLGKQHHYAQAIERYNKLQNQKLNYETSSLVQQRLQQWTEYYKCWQYFYDIAKNNNTVFSFRDEKMCTISEAGDSGIRLSLPSSNSWFLQWKDLTASEIYQLFHIFAIDQKYPWILANFCLEHRLKEELRKVLVIYLSTYPGEQSKAYSMLAELLNVPTYTKFQEHEGALYTEEEMKKIVPDISVPEEKKEPVGENNNSYFEKWQSYNNDIIKTQQKDWENDEFSHSDLSTELKKKEQDINKQLADGKVFFANKWQNRSDLGTWMHLEEKNKNVIETFGRMEKNNLYEITTETGNRYISNIVKKYNIEYPWDLYKNLEPTLNTLQDREQLALYCEQNKLDTCASIQWNKILSSAPNYPLARHAFGYYLNNNIWENANSKNSMLLPKDEWERMGLVSLFDKVYFAEEAEAIQWTNSVQEKASLENYNNNYITQVDNKKNVWQVKEEFNNALNDFWESDEYSNIVDNKLEVNTKEENTPHFAYLNIFWNDIASIKCEITFPEKNFNRNLLIVLGHNKDEKGNFKEYCIRLNWMIKEKIKEKIKERDAINFYHQLIYRTYNAEDKKEEEKTLDTQPNGPIIGVGNKVNIIIRKTNNVLSVVLKSGSPILKATCSSELNGIIGLGSCDSKVRFDSLDIQGTIDQSKLPKKQEKQEEKIEQPKIKVMHSAICESWSKMSSEMQTLWKDGRSALWNHKLNIALHKLNAVSVQCPNFPCVLCDLGYLALQKHQYKLAREYFNKALSLEPKYELALLGRGQAYQRLKEYDNAINSYIECYNLSSKTQKQNLLCYYLLLSLYWEKGEKDAVLKRADEMQNIFAKNKTVIQLCQEIKEKISQECKSIYTTEHYTFSTNENIRNVALDAIGAFLERFYNKYHEIFSSQTATKQKVMLFQTTASMYQYLQLQYPIALQSDVALWWNATNEICIAMDQHPAFLYRDLHKAALAQIEYTFSNIPECLYTSFEKYFSNVSVELDNTRWNNILAWDKHQIKEELQHFSWNNWLEKENQDSVMILSFLMEKEKVKFGQILKNLKAGQTFKDAYRKVFSIETDSTMENALKKYWKNK